MNNIITNIYSFADAAKTNLFEFFRSNWSHLEVKVLWLSIIITNLVIWLSAWRVAKFFSGEVITLHYNVDFGINLIGEPLQIYMIPVLGLLVFFFNLLLQYILSRNSRDRKLNRILLASATLATNLILLVALGSLYIVNLNR